MIKKILCAVTVALLLAAGHAFAQTPNLNLPSGSQYNLNNSSAFQAGTWVPVLQGGTTTGTFTYTTQAGSYEVIGRQVNARFSIVTTSLTSTLGGNIQITGLPVAANSSTGDYGVCNLDVFGGMTLDTGYGSIAGIITPGTAVVGFIESGSAKNTQLLGLSGGVGTAAMYAITATPATVVGNCIYRLPGSN